MEAWPDISISQKIRARKFWFQDVFNWSTFWSSFPTFHWGLKADKDLKEKPRGDIMARYHLFYMKLIPVVDKNLFSPFSDRKMWQIQYSVLFLSASGHNKLQGILTCQFFGGSCLCSLQNSFFFVISLIFAFVLLKNLKTLIILSMSQIEMNCTVCFGGR